MSPPLELDHLLYATPDVDATVAELEAAFGVSFRPGGRHSAWGTRNRILPLGEDCYLEVIGPDEEQSAPADGRLLGLDELKEPRMEWWAVRAFLMPLTCGEFETAGFIPGEVIEGRRALKDGGELVWQMTDPRVRLEDGMLPIVMDWEGASHPGADDVGVSLESFRLEHPDARRLTLAFVELGLPEVHPAEAPGMVATFQTPKGTVTLR